MKNLKDTIYWIGTISCGIFLAYFLIGDAIKVQSLKKNIEFTKAVIIDFTSGPRLRYYIDYKFYVNGEEYYGSGKHYTESDTFSVGDTITIVYDRSNPDNNRTYRDYK
jgi:hypothetical protein